MYRPTAFEAPGWAPHGFADAGDGDAAQPAPLPSPLLTPPRSSSLLHLEAAGSPARASPALSPLVIPSPFSPPAAPVDAGTARRLEYRMLRTLGVGSQAAVRLAVHRPSGTLCAVKAYAKGSGRADRPDSPAARLETVRRRELRILREHSWHPQIVHLLDTFETDRQLYLVFEYCAGADLLQYLEHRGGTLPEAEVAPIAASVARAVAYLHANGIVHRDLKPANVLIRDVGRVAETLCLADFGSAYVDELQDGAGAFTFSPKGDAAAFPPSSLSRPNREATLAGMKTIAGTPFFLPPELILGLSYGPGVDVWSLGCLSYQLLFGRTPFHAACSFEELYGMIRRAEIDFSGVQVSERAKGFLRACLHADPEGRVSAVGAMLHPWLLDPEPGGFADTGGEGADEGFEVDLDAEGGLVLKAAAGGSGKDSGYLSGGLKM